MSAPGTLTLPAPAKINVFLRVTGRRSDGYHTLETLLVPIDYGDRVTLALRAGPEIVRARGIAELAPDDDLAVRAARLLQRHSGVACGVEVDVENRIPVGSGLGGGRSDAATGLLALTPLCHLVL